jgi:hypothetical protein
MSPVHPIAPIRCRGLAQRNRCGLLVPSV